VFYFYWYPSSSNCTQLIPRPPYACFQNDRRFCQLKIPYKIWPSKILLVLSRAQLRRRLEQYTVSFCGWCLTFFSPFTWYGLFFLRNGFTLLDSLTGLKNIGLLLYQPISQPEHFSLLSSFTLVWIWSLRQGSTILDLSPMRLLHSRSVRVSLPYLISLSSKSAKICTCNTQPFST